MPAPNLSGRLISLNSPGLHAATRHPFLKQAALGELDPKLLVSWLAQDRLYALSYVTFVGQLLSKITVPPHADRSSSLTWRIADCLIDCLDNIRREIRLFEEIARKHGWMRKLGDARPSVETRAYKDVFAGAGQPSASLLKGLVTLWATEKCYLLAWSYAKEHVPATVGEGDVMQSVFIPNWSSAEFVRFVEVLEGLVDELGEAATEDDIVEAEDQWNQVVWAEENFWPSIES